MKKTEKRVYTEEEKRYILKAARLKGVADVEIEGLEKHLSGKAPNDFVVKRNADLFQLLEKRKKEKKGLVTAGKKAYVNLENVIISKVENSKQGIQKILTPGLTSYISKPATYVDEKSKFHELAGKNELVLPFVARAFDVQAATFLEVQVENGETNVGTRHITQNLVKEGETIIPGTQVLNKDTSAKKKEKKHSRKLGMNTLLEKTDRYVKKFCKKEKVSEEDSKLMRESIRKGLIKQTFINKLVLNDRESNSKWGLVKNGKTLGLLPLHDFEYCAGVINPDTTDTRRITGNTGIFGGREDIQSFMLFFGKEGWFRKWATEGIEKFSIDTVFDSCEKASNAKLSEQEKEYYSAVLEKTLSLAREVVEVDFDESQFGRLSLFKNRPTQIRKDIDRDEEINF